MEENNLALPLGESESVSWEDYITDCNGRQHEMDAMRKTIKKLTEQVELLRSRFGGMYS